MRNEKRGTTDFEIHRTRMYFLPVRSRLNCSAACLLYPPASRPRVHIDVRCARARFCSCSRSRYSFTSAAASPPHVCISMHGVPVSLSSSSSFSSSSSSLLLSVIFASRQAVNFDRRLYRRRQPHKWQMQKKTKCVSCIVCGYCRCENKSPARLSISIPLSLFSFALRPFSLTDRWLIRKRSFPIPPFQLKHLAHACFGGYLGRLKCRCEIPVFNEFPQGFHVKLQFSWRSLSFYPSVSSCNGDFSIVALDFPSAVELTVLESASCENRFYAEGKRVPLLRSSILSDALDRSIYSAFLYANRELVLYWIR